MESRKQEKSGEYSRLDPQSRELVDAGRIKVGMSMDAVYIAWGAPSEVVEGENELGPVTTWQYYGTTFEERRFWNYRVYYHRGRPMSEPFLDFDYQPINYLSAEVVFRGGLVSTWKTLNR